MSSDPALARKVGFAFVNLFVDAIDEGAAKLTSLYGADSVLTFGAGEEDDGTLAQGVDAIAAQLSALFDDHDASLSLDFGASTLDCQPVGNDILVVSSAAGALGSGPLQPLTQTFYLAAASGSYYIKNHVIRLLPVIENFTVVETAPSPADIAAAVAEAIEEAEDEAAAVEAAAVPLPETVDVMEVSETVTIPSGETVTVVETVVSDPATHIVLSDTIQVVPASVAAVPAPAAAAKPAPVVVLAEPASTKPKSFAAAAKAAPAPQVTIARPKTAVAKPPPPPAGVAAPAPAPEGGDSTSRVDINRTVFVRGITAADTPASLRSAFEAYGTVSNVVVHKSGATADVEFASAADKQTALDGGRLKIGDRELSILVKMPHPKSPRHGPRPTAAAPAADADGFARAGGKKRGSRRGGKLE